MNESALRAALDILEKSQSSLRGWLNIWTSLVVVGVVLEIASTIWEYREQLYDFNRGTIHTPDKPNVTLLIFGLLGAALVTAGVAGELVIDAKLGTVETSIRKANDNLYSLLSGEAGDAKLSATTAREEADRVAKEANTIDKRIGAASTRVGKVEEDVLLQGPRWQLLERGKKQFIDSLKPFRGQKSTVVICGQDDTERFSLEQMLINALRDSGWDSPGYDRWKECPVSLTGGNEVYFVSADTLEQWVVPYPCKGCSASSGGRTAAAGKALCDELNRLKVRTQGWMQTPIQEPFREQQLNRARMFFADGVPDSPPELALEQADRVFVLIGPK